MSQAPQESPILNLSLEEKVSQLLSKGGSISLKIDGFETRESQLEMALEISKAIKQKKSLVAEAGTGTGKTFAYLVPALLSGKKVIISTATKTLQEQLLTKDIPFLFDMCGVEGKARLLKGRENYLCPQRLEIAETAEQNTKSVWKKLALINEWKDKTKTGDKAELTTIDENDPI